MRFAFRQLRIIKSELQNNILTSPDINQKTMTFIGVKFNSNNDKFLFLKILKWPFFLLGAFISLILILIY
jgi:hypothetical protein